jgi:spermidine/putrescine transport system ATP-binding protein
MAGGHIEINDLCKMFGDVVAVNHIDLVMASGGFFSMLGPSGCGKTTTLRMIAGFESPTSGQVLLDGVDLSHTPPHKRPVNTVFQNYMIFPYLNVYENVAFGLRRQRCSRSDVGHRVGEALELVQLGELANRKPSQLSGGQQQRVALARALVLHPAVLLLDEPLGALDAKLRRQLQIELKALQRRVGITFVYVTHDQEEALTMSDQIAVMSHGVVEQVGTPREVYDEPTTEFVADFLGISNIIAADAEPAPGGGARLRVGEFTLVAKAGETGSRGAVKCVVRPERVRLEPYDSGGENRVPAIVEQLVYLGSATRVVVHLATGQTLQSLIQSDAGPLPYEQGTAVQVYLPADAVRVLRPTGQGVTERSRALSVNRQMARRWSLAPYRSRRSKGPHSDQSTGGSSERPR